MPALRVGQRATAALMFVAWLGMLIGLAILAAGGFEFRVGSIAVRAHGAWPPFGLAVLCAALSFRRGPADVGDALRWWWGVLPACAPALALVAAGWAVAAGAIWGTYVAGGSDSYCYLNQAEVLAGGHVQQRQSLAAQAPWPRAISTFAPMGHVPAADGSAAIVPACPTGYPVLLAVARLAGGRPAMFWIVPLFGGLGVWLAFVLGRRVAGRVTGAVAAMLLAASPTFLYQVTQPMTDVPAATMWTAALVVAAGAGASIQSAWLAGLLAGAALIVRPNLVPLVLVVASAVVILHRTAVGPAVRRVVAFGLGVLPFFLAILALNAVMYGGPFSSGYGRLIDLFTIEHITGNLHRYPVWLIETQTPFVLLALAAPWTASSPGGRKTAWWLLAFAVATFACYIPYTVWDAWWFLRFVLPALPPLLVLSASTGLSLASRVPPAGRVIVVASALGALLVFELVTSAHRAVFQLRDLEARFRDAGEYVSTRLPSNAVVFAVSESGSVRFYSGRETVRWDRLDAAWLVPAIAFLRREGYRPYLLLESDEEADFRLKFASVTSLGALQWPPVAEIDRQVRIYDPADDERYRRGESVGTDFVFGRR